MIEVEIEDEAWATVPDVEATVRAAAESALVSGGMDGDVTVLLTDDASIAQLNAQFRGKPSPTNVLSFPAAPTAHPHLGDIALAYGVCAREAGEQGKALSDHLTHLVVHGVLHLIGYDHMAEAEAEAMEQTEREILRRFGIADPYAQRNADGEP
jgi:probable rRNA maturation factor